MSRLFVPRSKAVKPQLKQGVSEIRGVGGFRSLWFLKAFVCVNPALDICARV